MTSIKDTLRTAVRTALKEHDRAALSAYRGALAAIENAEAVPANGPAGGSAGGAVGLGAAEAPRRELDERRMTEIVRREARSVRAAAAIPASPRAAAPTLQQAEAPAGLLRQAELLDALLAGAAPVSREAAGR